MKLYSLLRAIAYWPFQLAFLFRAKYVNRPLVPKEGPLVICCNHISMMDPAFLVCVTKRKIRFMAKAEAFEGRFLGWFLRCVGAFPIRRGEADLEAVKTSLRILKEGGVLGIFPEGHRQKPGKPRDEAHGGFVMLAAKTGATILPMAITGKNGRIRPFSKVVVKCGDPIPADQLGLTTKNNEEYKRVAKDIMDGIYKMKETIDFA